MSTKLFIIKQRGRNQFWNCSAEHGSGWSDGHPKQSFSPSELVKEICRLIDEKWFTDIEVCELRLADSASEDGPCEAGMPMESTQARFTDKARCPTCGRR